MVLEIQLKKKQLSFASFCFLLLLVGNAFGQCKFSIEAFDKINGQYQVQTNFKILEGGIMSSHSGEVALTKVYNLKDTSYFLILSKIITYQSNDDGISPRKIKKGSKSVLLLSNNVRTEVTAMQEVIEKKESKKAGSIGSLKEHRHSFKILYYLTPEQLDLLSEKSLVTLRVNMEDNLGNSAFQDIEVKEKFQNTIQNLLGCLKSRFVQR